MFWVVLAVAVLLAGATAVAMSGWNAAIQRADQRTAQAIALQTTAEQATELRQQVASLHKDLVDAQAREQALQAQLADGKAALSEAQDKAAAAERQAAAAEAAATDAERSRADAQARPAPAPTPAAHTGPPPQPASNISAADTRSGVAPELPLPGLPPGATSRDYLVAAQQALREGRSGRAQAALEHAETRILNQASLARDPAHPVSHPGVTEIEHALDQLGDGNADEALQTVEGLLARG